MTGLQKFVNGFGYAFQGLKRVFGERNFKFHLFAAVLVVLLSFYFQISSVEWIIVIFLIATVMSAEIFNTAIECLCDLLKDKLKLEYYDTWDPRNLGAAGTFIIALASAVIGVIIFLPKILALF